jgi:hypothetical protein
VATIKTAGVTDLVSIQIGKSSSNLGNSISLDADEEPTLSVGDITVNVVE